MPFCRGNSIAAPCTAVTMVIAMSVLSSFCGRCIVVMAVVAP